MLPRKTLLTLLIALLASSGYAQDDQLGVPDQYLIGGQPWSVFSADFNGDGYADLATVSYQTDSLTILLNDGDGTFTLSAKYLTGDVPVYVHGADIDGDTHIDLAVANMLDNTISIFPGNGDGTFGAPSIIDGGSGPSSVRLVRLDNNNSPDLVVTNEGVGMPFMDEHISVMYGNGDGTFQAPVTFGVGEDPHESAAADFNGDGWLDLAVVNLFGHTISVLLNNGDGSFGPDVKYESQHVPSAVSAADLDGDGDIDLIAPNSDAYDRSVVAVILNNGDGSFQPTVYYNSGGYPFDTYTCDLDQDLDIDIIVANWMTDSVSILLNNGDATFAAPIQYAAGDNPRALITSDLNNDTYPDLTVANRNSNDLLVYLNQGSPSHAGDSPIFALPNTFVLDQNRPNPFNPATTIEYNLVWRAHVNLTVYNVLGQQVVVLVDGDRPAGSHRAYWDGTGSDGKAAASGIYFYRLVSGENRATRKMVLVK